MRRAFIGLGSNLGDRWANVANAVAALHVGGDVTAVSPVYETEPVGGPEDQAAFLNAVVQLNTVATPRELLERCRRVEAAAGRVRTIHWGPRTLDADVLLVEGLEVAEDDLVVPHPRMRERRFVLQPLADLAPDLVTAEEIIASGGAVVRVGNLEPS